MKFKTSARLFCTLASAALILSGCKNSPSRNANISNNAQKQPTWIAQYRPPASLSGKFVGANLAFFSFNAISVVSSNIVFVAGDFPTTADPVKRYASIHRTMDGGKTWVEFPLRVSGFEIDRANAVHFVSPTLGWLFGSYPSGPEPDSSPIGVALKTTDGGSSWTASKIGGSLVPTCAYFTDAEHGWMGTIGPVAEDETRPSDLLATTDGGATWRSQRRFPDPINEVFFIDKQIGWLGAYKGAVYRTMDGGATWLEQTTGLEPRPGNSENISKLFSIYGIHFIDPLNGWAAARAEEEEGGRLIATTDGGNSWKPLMTTDQEKLRSVFFVNRNEGWVTSNSGRYIYHTSDAGKTWTAEQIVFEQNSPIYRIAGSDAAHMWAVGGGAIFARINQ